MIQKYIFFGMVSDDLDQCNVMFDMTHLKWRMRRICFKIDVLAIVKSM